MDVNDATTDSLRDTLAAAFEGADTNQADEAVNEVKADAAPIGEVDSGRDANGRFVKKSDSTEVVQQVSEQDQQSTEPVAPVQTKKPPQGWKQEYKQHFDTLPPELQDEILRRESDYSKGIQKYAEDAKYAQSMRSTFEQWMPYLTHVGATPEAAFNALIQTEYVFRTGSPAQKQQMIMKLAQDYGIELGGQQDQGQQTVHPDVNYATTEVQRLNQIVQQMQYEKQKAVEMQQQAEMSALQQQINEFSSKPEHSHFDEVREDMQALLAAGRAESLEDAYDKAVWARPDIRASLLKQAEAKRIQQQAEAANKAKAKAVSVTGSPSGASVPVAGASIRDDLRAALNASGGRL